MKQLQKVLPNTYQRAMSFLTPDELANLEELRLRLGRQPTMVLNGEEQAFPLGQAVSKEDVEHILQLATDYSLYQAATLKDGFLTLPGGHRIGICGTVVLKDGSVTALKHFSSLNLRVARERVGIALPILEKLGRLSSSIFIVGPPGAGKTTLLRDLILQTSNRQKQRISVVDERGELAASVNGIMQFDLGMYTDILTGSPKSIGIAMVLRTMNPQWIAIDEITTPNDIQAILQASYCGVHFLATAHAFNLEDLKSRPLYRALLAAGIFQTILVLDGTKHYTIERMEPFD